MERYQKTYNKVHFLTHVEYLLDCGFVPKSIIRDASGFLRFLLANSTEEDANGLSESLLFSTLPKAVRKHSASFSYSARNAYP